MEMDIATNGGPSTRRGRVLEIIWPRARALHVRVASEPKAQGPARMASKGRPNNLVHWPTTIVSAWAKGRPNAARWVMPKFAGSGRPNTLFCFPFFLYGIYAP